MAKDYKGVNGTIYRIVEPELGRGGEGAVYSIVGKPNYVLKVFWDKNRTETRHRKLLAMIATPLSAQAMDQITWPIDVVYDGDGFAGYIMPAVRDIEELNVMYSDKYKSTLSEKITIAKNLCAAVDSVHRAGQVCGDLNPKNIGVNPSTARVTLLDTDSYHITEKNGSRVYRCEVGLPDYLAREVQEKMKNGQTLASAPLPTFTKYTDLFALAVHIFALLMNGCHPFSCAADAATTSSRLQYGRPSVAVPDHMESICEGFFPFYMKKKDLTIPKYAPPFDYLPREMQTLFVRAFVDGHKDPTKRPTTKEWYEALSNMQKNLVVCNDDQYHMYPAHEKNCPWCDVKSRLLPVQLKTVQNTGAGSSTGSSQQRTSVQYTTIRRKTKALWATYIAVGIISGLLVAWFGMPIVVDVTDLDIPMIVGIIVLPLLGIGAGAGLSALVQERYQTSIKGWPWLLLSLVIPVALVAIVALISLAIAIVVAVISIAVTLFALYILCACCGG